jgi:hypothetical protein
MTKGVGAAKKKECRDFDTIYAIDIVSVSHDHQKVLPSEKNEIPRRDMPKEIDDHNG